MIKTWFFSLCLVLIPALASAEPIWIDVRSAFEYQIDHIDGDLRISHDEIVPEIQKRFPDKSSEIKLYCRSGARADTAKRLLNEAGYQNVVNVGGIGDARNVRSLSEE